MRNILLAMLLASANSLFAQQTSMKGTVIDEKGAPLVFATVFLLHPEDSTMAYYGVTNNDGKFEIRNITPGKYIMQSAYLGYNTLYKPLQLPISAGPDLGAILMKPKSVNLNEVNISAEKIPLMIKKDTIEYNAGAFKTKTDAVAEDLLKKLPGVEVDRSGNIKSQGEDVKHVLVDGKEFFGDDPKVATKNLPANAISKVQVYNKKSEETELTGIDDGTYEKTMNMILKDGQNKAWFGDVSAGGGTKDHYQAGAKVYRFTRKDQFALLGMINNVNKSGFSFTDYIDFNGGMGSFLSGNSMRVMLGGSNSFPVNFGQTVTGLVTSGAGGLNYTHEIKKNNRYNISYLGNGADNDLEQTSDSHNFTETSDYTQHTDLSQLTSNRAHRLNFSFRDRIDSAMNVLFTGSAGLSEGKTPADKIIHSYFNNTLQNELISNTIDKSNSMNGNVSGSFLRRFKGKWRLVRIEGKASGSQSLNKTSWDNVTQYFAPDQLILDKQYQRDENNTSGVSVNTSVTRKLGASVYLEPSIAAGISTETLRRGQGLSEETPAIDTLSPELSRYYHYIKPGLALKINGENSQFNLEACVESGRMSNTLQGNSMLTGSTVQRDVFYFVPSFHYENEFNKGRRMHIYYESAVNTPGASQLLPNTNTINPLQLYNGNRDLRPEYSHQLSLNWLMFDQFSFTSLFAGINGTYTHDKISWSRTVDPQFAQTMRMLNVPDDYNATAYVDFSTPIRKLGITLHATAKESWSRGISFIDSVRNTTTNLDHSFTLTFDNRKKEKWDVNFGGTIDYSDARYSLQNSLNRAYFNLNYFTEIAFTPGEHFHFSLSADVTRYNAQSFNQSVDIPLLRAEITAYFLKNKRGILTFEAIDLLDKNTGIERNSELNYIIERRSNIIGQYAMLTFKYRLNKFDNSGDGIRGPGGVNIKIGGKR